MSFHSVLQFNSCDIRFENRNGMVWVSLTDIANASGKQLSHWVELNYIKKFLTAVASDKGFTILETKKGQSPSKQDTWAIDEVALEFADWCYQPLRGKILERIVTIERQNNVPQPQTTQPIVPTDVLRPLEEIIFYHTFLDCLCKLEDYGNFELAQIIRTSVANSVLKHNQKSPSNFDSVVPPNYEDGQTDAIKKLCKHITNRFQSVS